MRRTVRRYARELLGLCDGKDKKDIERIVDRFGALLLERRQGSLLPDILDAVAAGPEPGAVEVMVTTAVPTDPKTEEAFRKGLEKKLDMPVHLRAETDPSLIGGATVRYGDVLFDGSLRQRLDALKQRLSQ